MSKNKNDELKLIYVLKIGYNSNNEGLYEFIFSDDETNIDEDGWCWDITPACDNAEIPEKDFIDRVVSLKIKDFDLKCLHEDVERPYMHGYNNIIALAYEVDFEGAEDGFDQYEDLMKEEDSDTALLVFHYGVTLSRIVEMFYERGVMLEGDVFIKNTSIEME